MLDDTSVKILINIRMAWNLLGLSRSRLQIPIMLLAMFHKNTPQPF
jgi:hypothetical protein